MVRSQLVLLLVAAGALLLIVSCRERSAEHRLASAPVATNRQSFPVKGVVQELKLDGRTVVIKHEAITNYMEAMTMPFRVAETNLLAGLKPGDEITFRLLVTENESWIDRIVRTGRSAPAEGKSTVVAPTNAPEAFRLANIPDFALTNEFGQPFSLRQLQGNAVAMTFFFTRCPVPDYCPRLTKNFAGAIQKLKATPGRPTNFHFLSISFDPLDSPLLLRAYAQQYRYDSNHWTFLTGRPDHIRELTEGFGLSIKPGAGIYMHDFRTAIFDATGKLQTLWPIGGDVTDQLAAEMAKAAQARDIPNSAPK